MISIQYFQRVAAKNEIQKAERDNRNSTKNASSKRKYLFAPSKYNKFYVILSTVWGKTKNIKFLLNFLLFFFISYYRFFMQTCQVYQMILSLICPKSMIFVLCYVFALLFCLHFDSFLSVRIYRVRFCFLLVIRFQLPTHFCQPLNEITP